MAEIEFKAKIETLTYLDGTAAPSRIKVPVLDRKHCDMDAFRKHPKYGAYANSDLFKNLLSKVRRERLGEYVRLDKLPEGVAVDASGFLAVVTLDV